MKYNEKAIAELRVELVEKREKTLSLVTERMSEQLDQISVTSTDVAHLQYELEWILSAEQVLELHRKGWTPEDQVQLFLDFLVNGGKTNTKPYLSVAPKRADILYSVIDWND